MYLPARGTLLKKSVQGFFDDVYAICFLIFFIKAYVVGTLLNCMQMGTHNICLYKVDKRYTGCNLEITELLDCVLIGVCAVIRANTVYLIYRKFIMSESDLKELVIPKELITLHKDYSFGRGGYGYVCLCILEKEAGQLEKVAAKMMMTVGNVPAR